MRLVVCLIAASAWAGVVGHPELRDGTDAAEKEQLLVKDPANREARNLLLAWYTRYFRDPRSAEPRLRHILYTIRNSPSMLLYDTRSLCVDERDPSFARVGGAWLEAAGRDPIAKLRAAQCLMRSDRARAAEWLRALIGESRRHPPLDDPPGRRWWNWSNVQGEATRALAHLLVDTMLGVTARDPWLGSARVDPALPLGREAIEAREEIDRGANTVLIAEAAWWLHLNQEPRPDRQQVALAWRWFERARAVDGAARWSLYLDSFQRTWSRRYPDLVPKVQ